MMLPTDLALVQDAKFKPHVVAYAKDQSLFFKDFSSAMAKLLSLGGPPSVQPGAASSELAKKLGDGGSEGWREEARDARREGAREQKRKGGNTVVRGREGEEDRACPSPTNN